MGEEAVSGGTISTMISYELFILLALTPLSFPFSIKINLQDSFGRNTTAFGIEQCHPSSGIGHGLGFDGAVGFHLGRNVDVVCNTSY